MEENQKEVNGQENANQEKDVMVENPNEGAIIEVKSKKKKEKKTRKGSYILGSIGAILGGLVAIIPWILRYMFARENFVITIFASLFSTLIPAGAYLGYKIFNGKMRKPFRIIITVISLLIIVLLTTIICPTILMAKSGYEITLDNFLGLYSDTRENIRTVIIEDFIFGIVCTIIGIVLVIKFVINKKIKDLLEEDRKLLHENAKKQLKEQSETIKKVCINLNCMNQAKAIKKKEILKQLVVIYNIKRKKAKLYFENCKANKLLRKYKGKYYYDENDEEIKIEKVKKIKTRFILKKIIVLLILIAVATGTTLYILYINTDKTLAGTNIKIKIDKNNQDFYGTYDQIEKAFGEEAASGVDFVLIDKANKYEVNGKAVPKSQFGEQDMTSIIQSDRATYVELVGEEFMTEVMDKQLGECAIKSYNYIYAGIDGNLYRSGVYLCEAENYYVWIGIYADYDVEEAQMDEIIDDFIK